MINRFIINAAVALVACLSICASRHALAGGGIFGSDIGLQSNLINSGTNTFFEATLLGDGRHAPKAGADVTLPVTLNSTGFNGLNLGTFNPNSDTLFLIGGAVLTFKNGATDITSASIAYSIDGGAFSFITLTFNEDNVNGASGDQRWARASTVAQVNVLSGLSDGNHTLAFYTFANTNSNGADPVVFQSNNGNNFVATFSTLTPIPEPSTVAGSLVLGSAALFAFIRKRRVRA